MTVSIPPLGITLRNPWGLFIVHGPKRIENRTKAVATQLRDYRGPIAITVSKRWQPNETDAAIAYVRATFGTDFGVTEEMCKAACGKFVATARVVSICSPEFTYPHNPWRDEDSWGILLDNIQPIPHTHATGGQGVWSTKWCDAHSRIIASSQRCPDCRAEWLTSQALGVTG